jgi:hypothetical protein
MRERWLSVQEIAAHLGVMSRYNKLLTAAVASIAKTFQKRVAAGLQSGRDFVIPNQQDQAKDTTDFDLVTWLVIKTQ